MVRIHARRLVTLSGTAALGLVATFYIYGMLSYGHTEGMYY